MIIVLLQLIKYSVTTLSKCLSILIRYKTTQFISRLAGLWPAVVHMWSCQHTHTCMGRANKSNSKQQLVIDRLMQVNNSKSKPVWYYSCAPFKTIFNLAINTLVGDAQSTQARRCCWSCTPLYFNYVIDPARLDPVRTAMTRTRSDPSFHWPVAPLLGTLFTYRLDQPHQSMTN